MNPDKENSKEEIEKDDSFNFRDYVESCLAKWQWFALSVLVICGLAVVYLIRREPVYELSEQILIKNEENGSSTDAISTVFSSMGLGSSNANVYNEMITLQSPELMIQVVERLGLNMSYVEKGFPHGTTLYGDQVPFVVEFLDLAENQSASFRMTIKPNGDKEFEKFSLGMPGAKPKKIKQTISAKAGSDVVRTPVGRIRITERPVVDEKPASRFYGSEPDSGEKEERTFYVSRSDIQRAADYFLTKISVELADKDAEVIDIMMRDVNVERAEAVLSTMVSIYNENWVNDKNRMATATSTFINERLQSLEEELGDVDTQIANFRSREGAVDLTESMKMGIKTTADLDQSMLQTVNELGMAQYLKEYVNNPANEGKVIPVNTGIGNQALESQIADYNNRLMSRNNVEASTSATNPIVKEYDERLRGQRDAIRQSINGHVASMEKAIGNMRNAQGAVKSNMASTPNQVKYLSGIGRQQHVKAELYLYLLQKREENQLSQKFTADNTRIITRPYGSIDPVSPRKGLTLAVAFVLSLLLPAGVIYLQEVSNNRVRSRKDLERMVAPFAGEIPYNGKKRRFEWLRKKLEGKKQHKKLETVSVVVQPGCRDMMNESFRIVRSNIDFMSRRTSGCKVEMVTSFNPGSGKSFVTYNLAASFAVKGKSVLIVDCDLRHGSSSQFVGMPPRGLSQYLTAGDIDPRSLVVKVDEMPGLSILPIGNRPPNPAELLDNGGMTTLLGELTRDYDYIFLDCPPVDIVVDTQILAQYADYTLFVVRAGLLERSMIKEIDEMYKSNRFPHISVLLNGTERSASHYGTYGSVYYSSDF